jgi:hypothetical protein
LIFLVLFSIDQFSERQAEKVLISNPDFAKLTLFLKMKFVSIPCFFAEVQPELQIRSGRFLTGSGSVFRKHPDPNKILGLLFSENLFDENML